MNTPYSSATMPGNLYVGLHQPIQQPVSTVVYVGCPNRNNSKGIFHSNQLDTEQRINRRNGRYFLPTDLQFTCSNTFPRSSEIKVHDVHSHATYSGFPTLTNDNNIQRSHIDRTTVQHPQHNFSSARISYQGHQASPALRQFVFPNLNLKTENAPIKESEESSQTLKPGHVDTLPSGKSKKIIKLPLGCTGLTNLGNTCYMNSVLQCLSHTKFLVDYCFEQRQKSITKSKQNKGVLANALADIFRHMWSGLKVFTPADFRKKMLSSISGFDDDACQQDAQEFLLFLLGSLHNDLKKKDLKKKHESVRLYPQSDKVADSVWKEFLGSENGVVVDIFMGQLRSSLTCSSCNYVSHTFEPAQGLTLPIYKAQNGTKVTLVDCLKHYFHKETLLGDEKPACSNCYKKSNATKCLSMQKFPKIFVIQLNRFSNNSTGMTKITTPVHYPIKDLNFKEFAYVDANVVYNLYAIVEHIGTLDNGHYMSVVKNRCNEKWYHYDDDLVRPMSNEPAVTGSEYILFYELHTAEKQKPVSILSIKNLFIDKL